MDPRIEAALDEWRFRACDPGYAGLHTLADAGFTGGVTTEETVGFMVNGRLVGINGGTTESFWGADFTALEADGPALPLLCAMLTSEQQEEGEYYTGETPISEVDETLASGKFTGFIELSENVFSGDYFVIYYGGRSFSAAFLGTEDRIVTSDEARQRAAEEVGIYNVNSVTVEVHDIPDPEVDESAGQEEIPEEEPIEPDTEVKTAQETETPEAPANPTAPDPSPAQAQQTERSESSEVAQLAEAALGTDPASIGAQQTDSSNGATEEWVAIPALDPGRTGSLDPAGSDPPQSSDGATPEPSTTPAPENGTQTPDEETVPESELDEAREENTRLRDRIEELEATIAELEAEEDDTESMTPSAAYTGTNLFVRYETRSNYTLEDAVEGGATREEVKNNLRLERHTTFDAEHAVVDGDAFDAFLEDSTGYRFSEWILADLLFDLVDSGDATAFTALLEVIPEIDRIEFSGEVPVHSQAGGDRQSHTYPFDLVFRNSMGDPVVVADVHESRSPVDGEAVGEFLSESNNIASHRSSLSGAFFVSQSYFEPAALETVADATSGGLLRGGSNKAYVSVSRKKGFHLCLIEARDDSFHLNIPDA